MSCDGRCQGKRSHVIYTNSHGFSPFNKPAWKTKKMLLFIYTSLTPALLLRITICTLNPGWHEKDEMLLHAAFQLLADFVEQESPGKRINWNHNAVHRRAWKEICDLYQWWKKKRLARRSPLDNKKIARPIFRFEKIPGTKFYRPLTPDKKKYAAYYEALKEHARLEQKMAQ